VSTQPPEVQNSYLEQVVRQKAQLEEDLKLKRDAPAEALAPPARARRMLVPGTAYTPATPAVDVRITGFWRWKNVIVPPNAHVVHTRRGHAEPLTLGMGVSFRFDPLTDSFLVVPASMQTIIIHANCICAERQGVVVQGYVQWIIDDFKTAYRKLDFSDPVEPMRVVNVQLREQAEAAIKDKVATMSIDEVLADKQPIIQELTARLRHVAEGQGQDKGLGLRIVTVQIKEAVVCSPRVWEMIQRPFRAERAKQARLAELSNDAVVREREGESERIAARLKIEAEAEIAALRARAEAEEFARTQADRLKRAQLEAEALGELIAHEKSKLEQENTLARLRLEQELALTRARTEAERLRAEGELALLATRRRIDNDRSPEAVRMAFVEALPAIAQQMPKPAELKTIALGSDGLSSAVGALLQVIDAIQGRERIG
jgi:regulator of protease activity HflC (stomatin/prohibitin superfamily)